jgi:hypothetical protein
MNVVCRETSTQIRLKVPVIIHRKLQVIEERRAVAGLEVAAQVAFGSKV